jgi:hypothetical protein
MEDGLNMKEECLIWEQSESTDTVQYPGLTLCNDHMEFYASAATW